jgi:hypothetical protein
MVSLYNQQYVIRRNLPGQRLGAKAWYWFFRRYISETLTCSWWWNNLALRNALLREFQTAF